MITSVKSTSQLSLEEFLRLPETKPASEYINGQIYQKPMGQTKHSRITLRLSSTIERVGESQQLAAAFPELRCTFAGRSLVPDIVVLEWSRIPRKDNGMLDNRCQTAPDWTIEIVSPEQSSNLLIEKITFCLDNGSQLGWLVDPEDESIVTFQPNQQPEVRYNSEPLPVLNILPDLQLSAKEIFSWLYM